MSKVGLGIVGSHFQADCIAHSVKMLPDEAEVVAVASPIALGDYGAVTRTANGG